METGIFYSYILVIFAMCVLFYTISRWIDYLFTKREDKRRHRGLVSVIDHTMQSAKYMTIEMAREINKNLWDMSKDDEL